MTAGGCVADAGELGRRYLGAAPGPGRVLAVFGRAAYLRLGDGTLVALVDRTVPRGPLHVRVGHLPQLRAGQPIEVGPGPTIDLGTVAVRVPAPGWTGAGPGTAGARVVRERAVRVGAATADCGIGADVAAAVARAVAEGSLVAAGGLVWGLGPGLTPAGDDVLAGLLLVAAHRWPPRRAATLRAIAGCARTNDIAAAFLAAAAEGQCIEPAHDLLAALTAADENAVGLRAAVQRLADVGASSGRALAWGIAAGLAGLPTYAPA